MLERVGEMISAVLHCTSVVFAMRSLFLPETERFLYRNGQFVLQSIVCLVRG